MKIWPLVLAVVYAQDTTVVEFENENIETESFDGGERKVPPRHPKQRLNKLISFSEELIDNNFSFWDKSDKYKRNFQRIGAKMEAAFDRCGSYEEGDNEAEEDENVNDQRSAPDSRYNKVDPCVATKQITTGFRKWAERYLDSCASQNKNQHVIKKMNKTRDFLVKKLFNSGLCIEVKFSRPRKGNVIQKIDSLGPDWRMSFEIKPTGIKNHWTNVLFATSASAKGSVHTTFAVLITR